MSTVIHVSLSIELHEAQDSTVYAISIDGTVYARMTLSDTGFLLGSSHDTPGLMLEVAARAWREFEKRDAWSDFSFEMEVQ